MSTEYLDTVIIGGGLTGLTVAEGLAKKDSRRQITVLERYPNVGGRVVTHRDDGLQYEIGAGRIFKDHKRVHALIRRFKLHTYPINESVVFRSAETKQDEPHGFETVMGAILRMLETIPASTLSDFTIGELLPKEWRPLLLRFPYWAELHMLRADLAAEAFKSTMGTYGGYVGVMEGIDAITTHLRDAVVKAGVDLRVRYRVEDVRKDGGGFLIVGNWGKKAEAKPFTIHAKTVILATCRCSLGSFRVLKGLPLLKQLQTSPLTRIYAVYPKGDDGRVWFDGMRSTVTDSPLRFVIPIDAKKGLIMISYTDGPDTKTWKGLEGAELQRVLQKEVRSLFGAAVPDPTYLQSHEWPSGCTYWVPGDYVMGDAIQKAMQPLGKDKGLYVVGESVSRQQAWMEGALESAEALLKLDV
jgi:glycine/D-amino acid oxidase-like deaminating enzyme